MSKQTEDSNSDFTKANFTAIISDLHICEEEPIHPQNPLWKKFKTREFFFDDVFSQFLEEIEARSLEKSRTLGIPHSIELVLNGDIFDFDSVTKIPEEPPYRVTWVEKTRGLHPEELKSVFKIQCILEDHSSWVESLRLFIQKGNKVVFVVGNHDLELLFPKVQEEIIRSLQLDTADQERVRFCSWFYISNQDSLIEHGHQYDPYCVCQNPIHPLVRQFNRIELRIPFGNLASRYMINVMGFFNPHVDSNYIMSIKEYISFFVKYIARTQPLLLWTWFFSSCLTLSKAFTDRLLPAMKDPLTTEDHIEKIARASNASPRMVRELNEIKVHPAASNPILLARELWLDKAFILLIVFIMIFQIFALIKLNFDISFFWMFIPLLLFVPFFLFYTKSFKSSVLSYKEPKERILALSSYICKVGRIVYGHTHIVRHEYIGLVEHLNPGTWSPAFLDIECTKPLSKRMYCWIEPGETTSEQRQASLHEVGKRST